MKQVFYSLVCVAIGLCVGVAYGVYEKETHSIDCVVDQHVDVDSEGTENFQGVSKPYTVLLHAPKREVIILPGKIGMRGEIVSVPDSLRRER